MININKRTQMDTPSTGLVAQFELLHDRACMMDREGYFDVAQELRREAQEKMSQLSAVLKATRKKNSVLPPYASVTLLAIHKRLGLSRARRNVSESRGSNGRPHSGHLCVWIPSIAYPHSRQCMVVVVGRL